MPLPQTDVSLSSIRSVIQGGTGQISMDNGNCRKLCGADLTSGTSWGMSDAKGKSWVISFTSDPTAYTGIDYVSYATVTRDGTKVGTYSCLVRYWKSKNFIIRAGVGTETYYYYTSPYIMDNGGGYTTTAPNLSLTSYESSWGGYSQAIYYGSLS